MVNLLPCPGALSTDNLAAVSLHDMAHQRKAQAAAFGVVNQRIAHPIELLENLLLLLMRNADALVHHFQLHRAVVAIKIHADKLSVLRILERVVHQIQQRTRHGLAIHPHRRHFVDLFFKLKTALLQLVAIGVQRVVHQFAHVGLAEVVFLAAGLDAGEIQDVVDERGQAFALFANDAVVLLIFFRTGEPAHLERLGIQAESEKAACAIRAKRWKRNPTSAAPAPFPW